MIRVTGAKGNIQDVNGFLKQVAGFAQKHHVIIQVFDAEMIFGKIHLISSVEHAIRAMDRKTNTTNSLDKEVLLYSSGERQLKLAIPKMGIKKGSKSIVFVFINYFKEKNGKISDHLINDMLEDFSLVRDDSVCEGNVDTLRRFGIDEKVIKTVMKAKYEDLILEKIAMVDIIK